MKLLLKKRMNVKTQNPMTFKNALLVIYKKSGGIKPKCGSLNILLAQNTDKAPPGHSRSPGTDRCLMPNSKFAEGIGIKSLYFNELQQFKKFIDPIIMSFS